METDRPAVSPSASPLHPAWFLMRCLFHDISSSLSTRYTYSADFFHMLYFGIASNLVLQSRNSLIPRLPDGCSKNTSTASAECVHIPSYVGILIRKDWHFRAVAKLESLSHFGCMPILKPSSLYYLIHI